VKKQRDKYAEDLEKDQVRHVVNVLDVFVKTPRPVHRGRVRIHVYKKENAKRNDPRQLMQLPQKEGIAEFNSHL
jgi:hypothetical protein